MLYISNLLSGSVGTNLAHAIAGPMAIMCR